MNNSTVIQQSIHKHKTLLRKKKERKKKNEQRKISPEVTPIDIYKHRVMLHKDKTKMFMV